MWLRGVATHLIGQFKVERCPYWLDVHLIECKAKPRAGSAITLSASDFEHILPSKLLTIPPGRWNLCCGYSRCCVPACQSVSPRGRFSANQLSAKLLCGANTWGSPWAKLRRCGDLFSRPGRHKIVCGGKVEETFDRRWVADLPEWSGIEECCWSSADGRLRFSPTRIVRAHGDVSLYEWVNLPHLSDVRVHADLETYVCMSPSQILRISGSRSLPPRATWKMSLD